MLLAFKRRAQPATEVAAPSRPDLGPVIEDLATQASAIGQEAAEVRGANLRIAVADQGIGMDKNEVKNIFRKFYRTEKAQKSGEAGTGIGLSIVEQIVAHHGGKIEVVSTPGKGSVFTIVTPVAPVGATTPPVAAQRA